MCEWQRLSATGSPRAAMFWFFGFFFLSGGSPRANDLNKGRAESVTKLSSHLFLYISIKTNLDSLCRASCVFFFSSSCGFT